MLPTIHDFYKQLELASKNLKPVAHLRNLVVVVLGVKCALNDAVLGIGKNKGGKLFISDVSDLQLTRNTLFIEPHTKVIFQMTRKAKDKAYVEPIVPYYNLEDYDENLEYKGDLRDTDYLHEWDLLEDMVTAISKKAIYYPWSLLKRVNIHTQVNHKRRNELVIKPEKAVEYSILDGKQFFIEPTEKVNRLGHTFRFYGVPGYYWYVNDVTKDGLLEVKEFENASDGPESPVSLMPIAA